MDDIRPPAAISADITTKVEKAKSVAPMVAGQIAGNAAATYSRAAQALMAGNDPRFTLVPSNADLAGAKPDDLRQLLSRPLGGEAEVVMVGDVTVDQAIRAAQATFGAGPGGTHILPIAPHATVPSGRTAPYVFEHNGRPDQAYYGEYFRLPDYFTDPKESAIADVTAAIISSQLVDTVREKLGITYSPQVQALTAVDLPGEGYLGVTIETPPTNFPKFHSLLAEQIGNLAAKPVSADELVRAKQPLIEAERKKRETNAFWLGKLTQIARDPRVKSETLSTIDRLSGVSATDVQAFIAKYAEGHQPVVVIARAKSAGRGSSQ